jgi:hypothetical protein
MGGSNKEGRLRFAKIDAAKRPIRAVLPGFLQGPAATPNYLDSR